MKLTTSTLALLPFLFLSSTILQAQIIEGVPDENNLMFSVNTVPCGGLSDEVTFDFPQNFPELTFTVFAGAMCDQGGGNIDPGYLHIQLISAQDAILAGENIDIQGSGGNPLTINAISAFDFGDVIGPNTNFNEGIELYNDGWVTDPGDFYTPATMSGGYYAYEFQTRYIGFSLLDFNNDVHYGYVSALMTGDGASLFQVTFGNAYIESLPDTEILIGDTIGGNFDYNITGAVFLDDNANGELDMGESIVNPSPLTVNGTPTWMAASGPNGYNVYVSNPMVSISSDHDIDLWTVSSTPEVHELQFSSSHTDTTDINFGLIPNGVQEAVYGTATLQTARCGWERTHSLSVINQGNVTSDGVLAYTPDSLFSFISSSVAADSIVDGTYYFGYSIMPFEHLSIDLQLLVPDFNFTGTAVSHDLELIDSSGETVQSQYYEQVVICSYDPNNKLAQVGWTEEGYVLEGTTLEYVINFQNTGTDTAFVVIIEDPLISALDTSSINVLDWSHPFTMSLDTNSVLTFVFDNVFLPDSATDNEGSQGFVSFSIDFEEGLEDGFLLENRARIFFDENLPIQTNTATNILYSCDELSAMTSPNVVCSGDSLFVVSLADLVEDYTWVLDGDTLSDADNTLEFVPIDGGEYEVVLITENFLCGDADTLSFVVEELDDVIIVFDGDSVYVQNPVPFAGYVWYIDGVLAQNAGGTVLYDVMSTPGTYSAEAVTFTGCMSSSNEVLVVVDLDEFSAIEWSISPNPMREFLSIRIEDEKFGPLTVSIIDATGKTVKEEELVGPRHELSRNGIKAGMYTVILRTTEAKTIASKSLIIE